MLDCIKYAQNLCHKYEQTVFINNIAKLINELYNNKKNIRGRGKYL